jgi:hypothetical protein
MQVASPETERKSKANWITKQLLMKMDIAKGMGMCPTFQSNHRSSTQKLSSQQLLISLPFLFSALFTPIAALSTAEPYIETHTTSTRFAKLQCMTLFAAAPKSITFGSGAKLEHLPVLATELGSELALLKRAAQDAKNSGDLDLAHILYRQFQNKVFEAEMLGFDKTELLEYLSALSQQPSELINEESSKRTRIQEAKGSQPESRLNHWMVVHTLKGHKFGVTSAIFSPDNSMILSTSFDMTAILWDAKTGEPLKTLIGHKNIISSAVFSNDGTKILTASKDQTVRIWNVKTGKTQRILRGHNAWVLTAKFSSDDSRIITSSADQTARIWDGKTSKEIVKLEGHTGWVNDAVFFANDTQVITTSSDSSIVRWDAFTGNQIKVIVNKNNRWGEGQFTVSPDEKSLLITPNVKYDMRLVDIKSGKILHKFANTNWARRASFNKYGNLILVTHFKDFAVIWDIDSDQPIHRLSGPHFDTVSTAVFNNDGSRILTASHDKTVKIWAQIH